MEEIVQGSPEWQALRLGKVTASRISDLLARTKSGWGASRANLMAELIAERLTGAPADRFTNAAMQWGTDKEPEARAAYEFFADCDVQQVGFVPHPGIAMAGCSPDGFVGGEGMVEIKCPNTATHLDTLLTGGIDGKYIGQMQFQMACAGRQWCDFVSFDPRLSEKFRLFVRRVPRDDIFIKATNKDVIAFLVELDEKLAALHALRPQRAAA